MRVVVAALVSLRVAALVAHRVPTARRSLGQSRSVTVMAVGVLQRKAKEAEVARWRKVVESDAAHPLSATLAAAQRGELGGTSRPGFGELRTSLTRGSGALGVIAEYHRKLPGAMKAAGVTVKSYQTPDINKISRETREAGAKLLAINMDSFTGGATAEDFAAALLEQEKARGDFPGPLPLIWADVVVDELQLAAAYAAGARGVTVSLDTLGLERCAALKKTAEDLYGLEVIVGCSPKDPRDIPELDALLTSAVTVVGATIILVAGVGVHEMAAVRGTIPAGVVAIARINNRDDQGLEEAEDSWQLRDAGYDGIWASDVLYKFGAISGSIFSGAQDTVISVIKAFKSKASTKYARASGAFSGRGEGAREWLGDILM